MMMMMMMMMLMMMILSWQGVGTEEIRFQQNPDKKQFINSELERIRSRKKKRFQNSPTKNPSYKFQVGKDSVPKKSDSKILGRRQENKGGRKESDSQFFPQGFPLRIVQTYAYKPGLLQNK